MNIAVINVKDLVKYILKFFIIIVTISFIGICLKNINMNREEKSIKENFINKSEEIKKYSFLNCLDLSISLISYTKDKHINKEDLINNKIFALETSILNKNIYKKTDLVINKEELTIDDVEELEYKLVELPEDVVTEAVEQNNIKPTVNGKYNTVEINNQSDYEITQEMLKPDLEIKNKKDILIYHTHTCESYTPTKRLRI